MPGPRATASPSRPGSPIRSTRFSTSTRRSMSRPPTAWRGFCRMPELRLDLRGLKCPLPVLITRKHLATLGAGDRVEVECSDPLAAIDIPHMLAEQGDILERQETHDGVLKFVIRKK